MRKVLEALLFATCVAVIAGVGIVLLLWDLPTATGMVIMDMKHRRADGSLGMMAYAPTPLALVLRVGLFVAAVWGLPRLWRRLNAS